MAMALLIIPREIRDFITLYSLKSNTGIVSLATFGSTPPNPELRLRLLEVDAQGQENNQRTTLALACTCRQMYNECKDLIWKLNTVLFEPESFFYDLKLLTPIQQRKIQHIQLQFDVLSTESLQQFVLSILGMFAGNGHLKSVTLNLIDPKIIATPNPYRDPTARLAFECQLDMLGKKYLKDVKEKRVLLDRKAEGKLKKFLMHISGGEGSLKSVQVAFGGEMWIDGNLMSWE